MCLIHIPQILNQYSHMQQYASLELGFSTFNIRQPSHKSITLVQQTYDFNITHYK